MGQIRWKRLLVGEFSVMRLFRSALIIYLILCAYAYFFSDRQIFLPSASTYTDNPSIIKLETAPNLTISAVYLANPEAEYTILFSHGNAEDLGDNQSFFEQLRSLGFAVFAYDYRGYGTSQGTPSVTGALQDINAAYQYMTQQLKIPPEQIIIHGRSVGGGPSTDLAARENCAGLVLESSFTSIFRVVIPFPFFFFDRFPNLAKIRQVKCPVLIIHGTQDQTIPLSHGQALYTHANPPKSSLWVEGAGHNDLLGVAGSRYSQALQAFAESLSIER